MTRHVLDPYPAHAVRGPKHVVKKGKTPVLNTDEARLPLDRSKVARQVGLDDGTEREER